MGAPLADVNRTFPDSMHDGNVLILTIGGPQFRMLVWSMTLPAISLTAGLQYDFAMFRFQRRAKRLSDEDYSIFQRHIILVTARAFLRRPYYER